MKLQLPPRDYLLGDILCTTSRWLLIGETGVGKTLFALEMAGAIAAGKPFLNWQGRRPSRVMYIDGEMPIETFKERIELIAAIYGPNIQLYGYNRDMLGPDELPPLNTEDGQKWLWREIEAVQPDIIFFDSIMCLLSGSMSEEESWAPIKLLTRQISAQRIAQVWLHHTGHDTSKGYGTKSREWEMDTAAMLSKLQEEGDEPSMAAFMFEFRKARLRTPANFAQFAPQTVKRTDSGFVGTESAPQRKAKDSDLDIMKRAFTEAYERLADSVEKSPGYDGAPVKKVSVEKIRDELKNRGFLDIDDKGRVIGSSRMLYHRAKAALLSRKSFVEAGGQIWRLYATQ